MVYLFVYLITFRILRNTISRVYILHFSAKLEVILSPSLSVMMKERLLTYFQIFPSLITSSLLKMSKLSSGCSLSDNFIIAYYLFALAFQYLFRRSRPINYSYSWLEISLRGQLLRIRGTLASWVIQLSESWVSAELWVVMLLGSNHTKLLWSLSSPLFALFYVSHLNIINNEVKDMKRDLQNAQPEKTDVSQWGVFMKAIDVSDSDHSIAKVMTASYRWYTVKSGVLQLVEQTVTLLTKERNHQNIQH